MNNYDKTQYKDYEDYIREIRLCYKDLEEINDE